MRFGCQENRRMGYLLPEETWIICQENFLNGHHVFIMTIYQDKEILLA